MALFLKKSIFLFFICAAIFLFANISITQAEVTCCTCESTVENCDPAPGGGMVCISSDAFVGFACMQGNHTCSDAVCPRGELNTGVTREREWRDYREAGAERYARGETVTCCKCSAPNTFICRDVDQECGTICSSHSGFTDISKNQIRGETEVVAEESATPSTSGEEKTPIEIQKPNIGIPIPGFIGFSEVKVDGEEISIPWIAEYVSAIFNWLMIIVGGVATVMIMVGGFIYLTAAGNQGQVGKGKEIITNALIGLLLAVGSYLILYTINPDLVSFKNIRLSIIGREEIGFENEPFELMQPDQIAFATTGARPVIESELVRVSNECLYTNMEAHPDIADALRLVSAKFCEARGSNTDWKIFCGCYRPPEQAIDMFVRRCIVGVNDNPPNCYPPTGNPFNPGIVRAVPRSGDTPFHYETVDGDLRDKSASYIINALRNEVRTENLGGHAMGLSCDCYCRTGPGGTTREQEGARKPYVPCQLVMERVFKESSFCRLNHENWHFETNEFRQSSSCNPGWTIGSLTKLQRDGGNTYDYSDCPNFWTSGRGICLPERTNTEVR